MFSVTCLGSGAFHPSAVSLAGALTPNRKALMITIFSSGGFFGLAFSQLIFSHFHEILGGNTALIITPTVILTIVSIFYGLKNISKFSPTLSHRQVNIKALFGLFKERNLRLLYIAQVSNQTIFWGTIFLLPDALFCKGYSSWMCKGGAHLFLILGAGFMAIPSGYLADRFSPKLVLLGATVGSLLTFYTFLYAHNLPDASLATLIFFMGAFLGAVNPVIIAFGNRLLPESPGMVSAFLMGMAWCLSEGLGQGGGGLLTKFFDLHAPVYAMAILGSFYVSGIIATMLLPQLEDEKNQVFA
jgi:FSR family fosmidomycin resistance protein-like MFS transporter